MCQLLVAADIGASYYVFGVGEPPTSGDLQAIVDAEVCSSLTVRPDPTREGDGDFGYLLEHRVADRVSPRHVFVAALPGVSELAEMWEELCSRRDSQPVGLGAMTWALSLDPRRETDCLESFRHSLTKVGAQVVLPEFFDDFVRLGVD